MTILIAGTVEITAANRGKTLAESADLMARTREQKGCMHYVWSADPTSDTRIYVFEDWESTEDLAAHLAGHFYQDMLVILGGNGVHGAEISKFKIAHQEPVYDPEGVPRADFFTL